MLSNQKKHLREKYKKIRLKKYESLKSLIYINVESFLGKFTKEKGINKAVGIYWPLKGEIDLRPLEQKLDLNLAFPACTNNRELNYYLSTNQAFIKDSHGIPAPINKKKLNPTDIEMLFVPGLAVDKKGFRLGYGGGFFDRLRAQKDWRKIKSFVVLPRNCFQVEPLPIDSWDIPFDGWINEDGVFEVSS